VSVVAVIDERPVIVGDVPENDRLPEMLIEYPNVVDASALTRKASTSESNGPCVVRTLKASDPTLLGSARVCTIEAPPVYKFS
jgi:hypothetical protein